MIFLYKANKYGIAYSLDKYDNSGDYLYTSTKWLLARWYVHGASFVGITTILSKVEKVSGLILGKKLFFSPQNSDIYSIINFSPIRVRQLLIFYTSKLFSFKSFRLF